MIYKVKGIVLHHAKYRESSAIVYLYTDLFGRQAYLIHSIRGKKSRYPSNLLQSLTFLELEAYHKEGRDLQKLREMRNYLPYRSIPYDLQKSAQAMFIGEVLYRVLREEDPNPELFEFLENSLQLLDVSDESPVNFHLLFLVQLTRFLGFFPENNYREGATVFDMRNGQFGNGTGVHPDFFDHASSELLHDLLGISFSDMNQLSVKQVTRVRFLENLMDYFRLHVQDFGRLKSLPVLHEVFSGKKEKSMD
jgi:DNA repair protein RecO (recombination protein O)